MPTEELLYSHITVQDRGRVYKAIERAETMHEGITLKCGFLPVNSEPRVASIHFDTEVDGHGALLKRRYVFQDVTLEHKRELLLAERERWFKTFFENDESIKLMIDPENGRIVDANSAALSFYGYSYEYLCSCHIQDINQLTSSEVAQEMAMARTHKRNYFHFRHQLRSGEVRDVEVYSTPITLKGRELLYSIVHDVTSREEAKRALIESEQRLKTFYQVAREAIIVHRDGVITDMNRSFERMFDVDAAHMAGKPLTTVFVDPDVRELPGSLFSNTEGSPWS